MRAILHTIFLRKLGLGKFMLSAVAFIVGFSLVLLALQGYVTLRNYITPKKGASNYVVLNKEVAMANTLFNAKAQFSSDELADLKQQPFVADFGVFTSSKFEASAQVAGALGFYTELFFESVPSRFIDDVPSTFRWEEGDTFLPIIISQDFLNLYNFGYAVGKGTPQLSKSTIQLVPLTVTIYGTFGRKVFNAKVVGFSERISSILAPEQFLTWANKNIAGSTDVSASRAIIRLKSEQSAAFDTYLQKHSIKVNDEKLKFSKILTALNVVMSVLVIVGTAFMVFSLVIVMLNFSLMIAQAKEEVSLLLQLGYKARHLTMHLSLYLLLFMCAAVLPSIILISIGNVQLVKFLSHNGIDVQLSVAAEVIVLGCSFIFISLLVSYYAIRRLIRKQL